MVHYEMTFFFVCQSLSCIAMHQLFFDDLLILFDDYVFVDDMFFLHRSELITHFDVLASTGALHQNNRIN